MSERGRQEPFGADGAPVLWPVFLKLGGRPVLVVGGGAVAASKAAELVKAGARVTVVAPHVAPEIETLSAVAVIRRAFDPRDLEGAWFVVAAAPPEVNRAVALAGERRRVFVNAVDDVENGTAYTAGVIRRAGVTIAVSTEGRAPALAGLLREGIQALLPDDLDAWVDEASRLRREQRAGRVPMPDRRPGLLRALNGLYADGGAGR